VLIAIAPSFKIVQETDPNRTGARGGRREREHVPWADVLRGMLHPQMLEVIRPNVSLIERAVPRAFRSRAPPRQ